MTHEVGIRMGFFFGILAVMAVWEISAPRRSLTTSKKIRWFSNLWIIFLNTVMVSLISLIGASTAPIGMALLAQERGWGLLNNWALPEWLAVVLGVVALDFIIYFQHVLFHSVPALWRLHSMHHVDLDLDVTTGLRFHPIEIILSLGIKLGAVAVLGPPMLAVLIFEVLLNGTSMFNHGNVLIHSGVERLLRLIVVTPDMHRVHHSVNPKETNSNFGFNLPWWDRLLGTYRAQPTGGHEDMTIGLNKFRDSGQLTLLWLFAWPFIRNPGGYPMNRRGGN
ncbi:MAG: sterol desaturase family protein [Acidobacteriota bacterium]|jgi:sterol desaturase/sphingolipid hydroxylase (fatty acid hydroxylase superfamily)